MVTAADVLNPERPESRTMSLLRERLVRCKFVSNLTPGLGDMSKPVRVHRAVVA